MENSLLLSLTRMSPAEQLKQGLSERTVLRRIKMGVIPYKKNEGEKAFGIPTIKYNEFVSHDGVSKWFHDNT